MPNISLKSKRVRRDYSRKSFSNPLFSKERAGGRPAWRRRMMWAAAAVALGGWVWFVAFSSHFRVDDIQVRGNQNLTSWEIRDTVEEILKHRRWLVFPQSSLLVVSESALENGLNERYVFESLKITKAPPRTLIIDLQERVSAVLLQLPDGHQALIDLDGQVTRVFQASEALEVAPKLGPVRNETTAPRPVYPVIYDDRQESFELRQAAMRPEIVQATIGLSKAFTAAFGNNGLSLTEIHLDGAQAQTLRAVTSEGWALYLDGGTDLATQLTDAQTVLKDKIGPDRPRLSYIDVRFGEKIFFKLRN